MKNIFVLYAPCIPVKGASRSVVCDIQRGDFKFIPNTLFEILTKHKRKSLESIIEFYGFENKNTIEEYFAFLIVNQYGFWSDKPSLFPPLKLDWDYPGLITNGIIDVSKNSKHNFEEIFIQYEDLGCKALQLRFYDLVKLEHLKEILINTNGSNFTTIELIIKYNKEISQKDYINLINSFLRISSIIVHSSPKYNNVLKIAKNGMGNLVYFPNKIDSHTHCGVISKDYFSLAQDSFIESQNFNTCLNRKISIDIDGNIKNCPSLKKSYGNISNHKLKSVVEKKEFKKLWSISKDQIETCKDCEFRHICTDCRAFHENDNTLLKPKKCSYDPYTMTWSDNNSSLKKKMGSRKHSLE